MIGVISRPVLMDEAFVSLHAVKKLSSRKRCQDVEIGALEAIPGTELQGTMENTGIVVVEAENERTEDIDPFSMND